MKKTTAGIISLYYNNYNYGGLLQAYALVATLQEKNIEALQIPFDRSGDRSPLLPTRMDRFKSNPVVFVKNFIGNKAAYVYKNIKYRSKEEQISPAITERNKAFKSFELTIPHTRVVNCSNVADLNKEFDVFICGSDQVWNPEQLRQAYLLSFVQTGKKKISYAASIGRDKLNESEIKYIADKISDFNAISVREQQAKQMLADQVPLKVDLVLDPTLLRDAQEWEAIEKPYDIGEKYLLTYFLGDSKKQRESVTKFAKNKGLKIVGFPHILGEYRKNDEGFADYEVYDADPAQFLYLIRNAEYVITDSFHACVFSIIYEKKFLVFERDVKSKNQKMNSRIETLLDLFGIRKRLADLNSIDTIDKDFEIDKSKFYRMKEDSIKFLERAVKG